MSPIGQKVAREKNHKIVIKEALIGEHNLKPLLTGHKDGIDW